MEKPTGYPEHYTLGIPEPLKAVGRAARWCVEMHLLSPRSDHFVHPLDEEPTPVTDWPGQQMVDSSEAVV